MCTFLGKTVKYAKISNFMFSTAANKCSSTDFVYPNFRIHIPEDQKAQIQNFGRVILRRVVDSYSDFSSRSDRDPGQVHPDPKPFIYVYISPATVKADRKCPLYKMGIEGA